MRDKLDLVGIQVGDGRYCIANRKGIGDCYFREYLHEYLFDEKSPGETFLKEWVMVDRLPEKVSFMKKQPDINYRYELMDKSLISEKIPEILIREEVAKYEDYGWIWNDEMRKYESLYELKSDAVPDIEVVCEFDLDILFGVSNIVAPIEFGYKVPVSQWESDGFRELKGADVNYKLIEKIFYPEILLPQRACFLTSKQSYKIVRKYIQDNIDPRFARITSDYDFCFTVKRRIPLSEVKKYTVDVNFGHNLFSKRKRKAKYVEKRQAEREEVCFEMTSKVDNYKGYTPIKGFEAKNQEELKEKIDKYCEGLINFINTPFYDCPQCKGDGVLINSIKKEKK